MKNIIRLLPMLCFLIVGIQQAEAQNTNKKKATSEFTVNGVCGECERRIESAALIKGVKYAQWNRDAQTIKVIYNPSKVDQAAIEQAISSAGHDTQNNKAMDEAYTSLPDCCRYRDGIAPH